MHYASRARRRRREHIATRAIEAIQATTITLALGAMLAWVLLNWIAGCGEVFTDINGNHIAGECLLVPWED